jgi:predicted neuraminidase
MSKISSDHGKTWSSPVELVEGDNTGGRGPVKNPLLVLQNGDWVAGASKEVTLDIDGAGIEKGLWDCFADVAPAGPQQGSFWLRSPAVPLPLDRDTPGSSFQGPGIIQPTLWQTPKDVTGKTASPSSVHMLTRSSSGWVMRSDSTDGGRTWSPAYPTPLPNNNSGLCLAYLSPQRFTSLLSEEFDDARQNGRVYIAHNPNSGNWGARTPLIISISDDQGETWKTWRTLEDLKPPEGYAGIVAKETGIVSDGTAEFSYPTVVPTAEGDEVGVWCSYTWQRKGIVVTKLLEGDRL